MEENAQYEIRQYANTIGHEIVKNWVPVTWEAFLDYRRNSLELSGLEFELLKIIAKGDKVKATKQAEKMGLISYRDGKMLKNFERWEFEEKLNKFEIPIPWK